jgi:hypothetical protein
MKKTSVFALVLLVVLVASISTAAAASKTVFRAGLSGAPETGSDAHGNAVFQFADDGSALKYKLVVNGLDNTTMAHIHVSDTACMANTPVLWLYPDAPPPQPIAGTFNGLLGGRTVTSADLFGPGASQQNIHDLSDLRQAIEDGRAYVLVHSEQFPAGEICGVIH